MKAVIYNRAGWIHGQLSSTYLSKLEDILHQSGFMVLNDIDHQFSPVGYTRLWLLGESHFAVHSFPEENVVYIELSSCVRDKAIAFWNYVHDWGQKNQIQMRFTQLQIFAATE